MKRLFCSQCGANLTKNEDGDYSCEYCNSVYKSKREKGKVFVKDSYYKFDKEDEVKDIETVSKTSSADFSYKKVKPSWIYVPIVFVMVIVLSVLAFIPKIQQDIENNTPQTITYIASDNGYIYFNGEKYKEYTCDLINGDEITISTISDEGYKFSSWSDGSSNSSRNDTKTGKESVTYTAYFTPKQKFTLRYYANSGGYIDGETQQTVYEKESGSTVEAVPNKGYYFVKWSDGLQTATRTDDYVLSDKNVYAEFYSPFDSGSGTENDPFIISSTDQFLNIKGSYNEMYFKLSKDLNFKNVSDLDWRGFEFKGTLDGNNHTIKDLKYSLFTNLVNAEIKNIIIDDSMIYNTLYSNYYSGLLANSVSGEVKISNIQIKNSHIELHHSEINYLGILIGLVKKDSNVVIDGCLVESSTASQSTSVKGGSSKTTYFTIGGLVGYVENNATVEIKNCDAQGTLIVYSYSFNESIYNSIYAGGLIGNVSSGSVIKINDNVISSALRLNSSKTYVYVAGLIGISNTNDENVSQSGNKVSMDYPETNENTKVYVYYEEIMN